MFTIVKIGRNIIEIKMIANYQCFSFSKLKQDLMKDMIDFINLSYFDYQYRPTNFSFSLQGMPHTCKNVVFGDML